MKKLLCAVLVLGTASLALADTQYCKIFPVFTDGDQTLFYSESNDTTMPCTPNLPFYIWGLNTAPCPEDCLTNSCGTYGPAKGEVARTLTSGDPLNDRQLATPLGINELAEERVPPKHQRKDQSVWHPSAGFKKQRNELVAVEFPNSVKIGVRMIEAYLDREEAEDNNPQKIAPISRARYGIEVTLTQSELESLPVIKKVKAIGNLKYAFKATFNLKEYTVFTKTNIAQ